jgi:hypothetical protein
MLLIHHFWLEVCMFLYIMRTFADLPLFPQVAQKKVFLCFQISMILHFSEIIQVG